MIEPKVWENFKRTGFINEFQKIHVPENMQEEFASLVEEYKEKNY